MNTKEKIEYFDTMSQEWIVRKDEKMTINRSRYSSGYHFAAVVNNYLGETCRIKGMKPGTKEEVEA